MIKSTFISFGLHSFLIILAYLGLPAFKVKEPIEQPIDIVDDTPVSTKTSLKFGNTKKEKLKETKIKKNIEENNKKIPPPPLPTKKIIEKKNSILKKEKEIKEIASLIKKKPKLKIEKKKKPNPPKVVKKPKIIENKQKENLAKGILKTLTKPENIQRKLKKDKKKNNKEVLKKIRTIVGNSNRQVQKTEIRLSQTDINRIQMHVTKYFNLSYAASEVKRIIPLKISANTDGTIKSARILDKSSYEKNKFYRAAADAARRAVLDSSPLPLPKGKEKKFENFIFDFNTSFINDY